MPVVGLDPVGGIKSTSEPAPDSEGLHSLPGSNCSHLTLKLEFSTEVVEHGEKHLSTGFLFISSFIS